MTQYPVGFPAIEGIADVRDFARDPRSQELRYSTATSLVELSKEYTFFTHGLFFTYGGLDPVTQDPVHDFINHHPQADLSCLTLDCPGDPAFAIARTPEQVFWNHRLLGVETVVWPELKKYLAGIAVSHYTSDPNTRRFWLAQWQHLDIVDRLAIEHLAVLPALLPTITINVFGLSEHTGKLLFYPRVGPEIAPVRLLKMQPDPDVQALAAQWFAAKDRESTLTEIIHGSRDPSPPRL